MKTEYSRGQLMSAPLEKFQSLLRELFQFDCADLDFGIYRILNHKRAVIENFIGEDLPKAVKKALARGALAAQSQTAQELEGLAAQIRENIAPDAIDAEGALDPKYSETKLGKRYQVLKSKANGGSNRDALQAAIFNHLYSFFGRYYQEGDFISKRRYSRREKYAIPYSGEEVYLYWANRDQYYIKTAEHFTDYSYKAPDGVTISFKIAAADVEQNNVKGEKCFFLPRMKEIAWNGEVRELVVPFEYRPLVEQEQRTYGSKNQQEAILNEALEAIPKQVKRIAEALAALTSERHKDGEGEPVSHLAHHLRQYTRRNTSDFFIHKDLKGFLTRELDFYLKNEVLGLDEVEAAGAELAAGWFEMMHVIKQVGGDIIEFLAQIEDFQKMIWEKRKFITEVQYCITLGNIAEGFYPEIAANDAQWKEWRTLLHLDKELFSGGKAQGVRRMAFLKKHQTLVVDTKHFDAGFKDRLLASFDDLDGMTDGLLIHGENWQALQLLEHKHSKQVHCIYIDPPYNTGSDGFLYKDTFQHSSWMTMFENRILAAKPLLNQQGMVFVHIDNGEQPRLRFVGENVLGEQSFHAMMVWKNKYGPGAATRGIGDLHEYVVAFLVDSAVTLTSPLDDEAIAQYTGRDSKYPIRGGFVTQPLATRSKDPRPNLVYPIKFKGKEIWPDKQWIWSRDRMEDAIANDEIVFNEQSDGSYSVRFKQYLRDENGKIRRGKPLSLLLGPFNQEGNEEIENLFGDRVFTFPKPAVLGQELLAIQAEEWQGPVVVLDYLAGSGTTGHAVINLNREDGGRRRFILVEMAKYFDTVLLSRIKKVTFTPEWKDGKPKRVVTKEEAERGPRIVKYLRLESYEDALNNIAFDGPAGQKAMEFEDYLLTYMLRWETKKSETLLNIKKLDKPFSYKLHIHADGDSRSRDVDIPETFNYLLGLNVEMRNIYDDHGRRYLVYRGRANHRRVAVIWRETDGWKKADFERDKRFVLEQKLAEAMDEVFVNGDSFIPGARALEPVFKARMFASVED
jgi:adenine-specific DNA-methyltransferase